MDKQEEKALWEEVGQLCSRITKLEAQVADLTARPTYPFPPPTFLPKEDTP